MLTTEEEGRLAYGGAVATAPMELPETIAVCDVGGASTEIAVGSPGDVPGWVRSVDLGSVRLATRIDSARFGDDELGDARAETGAAFAGVEPPRVEAALAVGGSARAARRLVGATLGADELAKALRIVQTTSSRTITRRYGVDRARVRILPPASSSSPRCRAASEFRYTCATAASARAQSSPGSPKPPPNPKHFRARGRWRRPVISRFADA